MKELKKEDITVVGIVVCWSENSEINKLKHKQSFTATEFEEICKKQDEIFNNQEERLGYDKTKYQVVYFVNSEKDLIAKSYTNRVDIGDGEKHMPTEDSIKNTIINIEQRENRSKYKSREVEM
ncbi:MAG: hypothetical protein N2749_06560 [Clostridia bacterium]|nr:hypothetical protein [Clostridia bacterium]